MDEILNEETELFQDTFLGDVEWTRDRNNRLLAWTRLPGEFGRTLRYQYDQRGIMGIFYGKHWMLDEDFKKQLSAAHKAREEQIEIDEEHRYRDLYRGIRDLGFRA